MSRDTPGGGLVAGASSSQSSPPARVLAAGAAIPGCVTSEPPTGARLTVSCCEGAACRGGGNGLPQPMQNLLLPASSCPHFVQNRTASRPLSSACYAHAPPGGPSADWLSMA
jgi:hypothetical protein